MLEVGAGQGGVDRERHIAETHRQTNDGHFVSLYCFSVPFGPPPPPPKNPPGDVIPFAFPNPTTR